MQGQRSKVFVPLMWFNGTHIVWLLAWQILTMTLVLGFMKQLEGMGGDLVPIWLSQFKRGGASPVIYHLLPEYSGTPLGAANALCARELHILMRFNT